MPLIGSKPVLEYTIEMRMKFSDGLKASDVVSIQVKTWSASDGCKGTATMPLLGAGMILLSGGNSFDRV